MASTRWLDNENKDLDKVIEMLLSEKSDKGNYINISTRKMFENNLIDNISNMEVTFNYIHFSYSYVVPGDQPLEDRSKPYDGYIIVYSNQVNINYIINRNSNAKTLLRLFLGYDKQNEIVENNIGIESDFFVWLISKVFKSESSLIIDGNENQLDRVISIDEIKGFKGDSADELTKVSATGRSVMNIISTLSFLLESNLLNQIILDVEYLEHENIELILSTKQTVSVVLKEYDGPFEVYDKEKFISYVYLCTYLEVLPILNQTYQIEIENDDWGIDKYREFLRLVANKLQNNVEEKIVNLEKEVIDVKTATT